MSTYPIHLSAPTGTACGTAGTSTMRLAEASCVPCFRAAVAARAAAALWDRTVETVAKNAAGKPAQLRFDIAPLARALGLPANEEAARALVALLAIAAAERARRYGLAPAEGFRIVTGQDPAADGGDKEPPAITNGN